MIKEPPPATSQIRDLRLKASDTWTGASEERALTQKIPYQRLSRELERAHRFPRSISKSQQAQEIQASGAAQTIPDPPCHHATLSHQAAQLRVADAQSHSRRRSALLYTTRFINGEEQEPEVELIEVIIPPGRTRSNLIELTPSFQRPPNGEEEAYKETVEVRLLPVEFKDYFGGSLFNERMVPKCCAEKARKNMLTHLYLNQGSEKCVYLHSGDTLDVSVRVPKIPNLKYELIYEFFGEEIERKKIEGAEDLQIVKYDPTTLDFVKQALGKFGFEMDVYLVITDGNGKEVLKSSRLKVLVDDAHLRNNCFKIKIDPFGPGWKGKGSYSELLMGMMLHEVSREIVKLVAENTINHTRDPKFDLQEPRATQGTNRQIIGKIDPQIGKAGSEWDKASDYALNVETASFEKDKNQILIGNLLGAKKTIIDAIFHDAFNEFEKIENKIRGEGWGKYGCPCGGDNEVLKAASLRGVNSPEVLKKMAQYFPAAALGIALLPRSFIEDLMKAIQESKVDDLKKNFEESWEIGGCRT